MLLQTNKDRSVQLNFWRQNTETKIRVTTSDSDTDEGEKNAWSPWESYSAQPRLPALKITWNERERDLLQKLPTVFFSSTLIFASCERVCCIWLMFDCDCFCATWTPIAALHRYFAITTIFCGRRHIAFCLSRVSGPLGRRWRRPWGRVYVHNFFY